MAQITATNILTQSSISGANTFFTQIITVLPGYLYIIAVGADNGGTNCPDPTITQSGVTWTKLTTTTDSGGTRRLVVWYAIPTSSATASISIAYGAAIAAVG